MSDSETKTLTEIRTETVTASTEMEGGIVVNAESTSEELDEFSFVVSDEKLIISPCDAVVTIESYYRKTCRVTLAEMLPGVILVTGGNIKERRKMGEWLCATLRAATKEP